MDGKQADEPCRMVRLEWDRGHEVLEAILRARTESGVLLTLLHDYTPLPGVRWIADSELLDVDDLDDEDPSVRLADLRGDRSGALDEALTDLPTLLRRLQEQGCVVAINDRRTGSRAVLVGHIIGFDDEQLALDEITPKARLTGDTLVFELDEIISISWGDPYLAALTDLLEAETAATAAVPDFDAAWCSVTNAPPIGHHLKDAHADRWVRFWYLPDGKRYATNRDEEQELLRRANIIVSDAVGDDPKVMVVTGGHGDPGAPPPRAPRLLDLDPTGEYWREAVIPGETGPDDALPFHAWASWRAFTPGSFDDLIRDAAEWVLPGVLIVAPAPKIIVHPYDGGLDVILPTSQVRDRWHERYRDWASRLESGL